MFILLLLNLLWIYSTYTQADTIDNYMNVYNAIPQMELKADFDSQVWARSARNVLAIANETIAETLMKANDEAKLKNHPFFCFLAGETLTADLLGEIILNTYKNISSQQSDKNKMTVSQIAWLGLQKKYPCKTTNAPTNIFNDE